MASNSPRRKELLSGLDIEFEVKVISGIDESYPAELPVKEVAEYIAKKKATPYSTFISENDMVITADTIVVSDGRVMGKPQNADNAFEMLSFLSGKTHQVYTGVCLLTKNTTKSFSVATDVTFRQLTPEEIWYYIDNYKPMDKAGSYGIQEWIGYIGITGINGSYFNVMGLPVQRIHDEIERLKQE